MIYVDVRLPFRNIENPKTNILTCKYTEYTTNKQIFSFTANITHVSSPKVRSYRSVGLYMNNIQTTFMYLSSCATIFVITI